MKRFLVLVAAMAAFSTSLFAGDITKEIKISNINKLDVSYCFDVVAEKCSNEYLTIIIDEDYEKYLVVKAKDGLLSIGIDTDKLPVRLQKQSGDRTFEVKVGVKELAGLDLSGATSFSSDDVFVSKVFKCNCSGASKVLNLRLESESARFGVSGASKIDVDGMIHECHADVSGASVLNFEIESIETEINASGASKIFIDGEYGELDIECSGASRCVLKGAAKDLNIEGSGASKFQAEDMVALQCDVDLSGASVGSVQVVNLLEVDLSGASKLLYNRDVNKLEVDDISSGSSLKKR